MTLIYIGTKILYKYTQYQADYLPSHDILIPALEGHRAFLHHPSLDHILDKKGRKLKEYKGMFSYKNHNIHTSTDTLYQKLY